MNIQPTLSLILALILATIVGGAYNALVSWANTTGKTEGYTALLVVGGVVLTLAFTAFFVEPQDTLIVAAFFIATGTPMLVGDIVRYIRRREKGRKLLK